MDKPDLEYREWRGGKPVKVAVCVDTVMAMVARRVRAAGGLIPEEEQEVKRQGGRK